MVKLYTTKWLH